MPSYEPAGVVVDPALLLAFEDRRERSARALAAAVMRDAERRAAAQARIRGAVGDYLATAHQPIHLLVLPALAARPSL